jgi:hypothetical protein
LKVPLPGGNTAVAGTVQPVALASNGQNANPNLGDVNIDSGNIEATRVLPSSFSSALANAGSVAVGYNPMMNDGLEATRIHEQPHQTSTNEVFAS